MKDWTAFSAMTRREMLKRTAQAGALMAMPGGVLPAFADEDAGVVVNDVQSQLNATRVRRIETPGTVDEVQALLRRAHREDRAVSVCGGRHAMGGQQFGRDTILCDMRPFNRVVHFDAERGLLEVQGGMEWPELIQFLHGEQAGALAPWTVRQKQTGVDRVSMAGSLSANIHGRGLEWPPFVSDVESFVLADARGELHTCSRTENQELFSLAIGGYGLFGVIVHVTLRLVPRMKMERAVEVLEIKDLVSAYERRLKEGFLYGDCPYSTFIDPDAETHHGLFSCYRPVPNETPIPSDQKVLSSEDWAELYVLARTEKQKAFDRYTSHYLATSGQIYWSDSQQMAGTFDDYRQAVDARRGTEMITEVYVSKDAFLPFMTRCREDFVRHDVDMTYGTIRFIAKDTESFLAWAKEPSICVICNLHVRHTDEGIRKAGQDFRRIIDRAIEHDGRYFLTYHRWARRDQVEACYPQFAEFLRLKRKYDPHERFQSEWYRHYRALFADSI